jgi:hypothetical protein
MANVRPLNTKRYEISRHRFWELYHFCLQYNEWKDELKWATDTMKSVQITDMPHGTGVGDPTKELAIRREKLSSQCKLIEETAMETDAELWEYILKGVTTEEATYTYLRQIMRIPCGKNQYYQKRRKFFYLLSKKI